MLSLYKCSSHDSLTVKKSYHLDLAWVITLLQQQGTFISYFEIAVIPLSTQWTKKLETYRNARYKQWRDSISSWKGFNILAEFNAKLLQPCFSFFCVQYYLSNTHTSWVSYHQFKLAMTILFCFVLFFLFCGVIRKSFLIIWKRPWIVPNTWQKVQQWCAWNFARLQRTWSLKITLSCASLLSPCSMSWRYSMNCFLAGMVVWLMVVH